MLSLSVLTEEVGSELDLLSGGGEEVEGLLRLVVAGNLHEVDVVSAEALELAGSVLLVGDELVTSGDGLLDDAGVVDEGVLGLLELGLIELVLDVEGGTGGGLDDVLDAHLGGVPGLGDGIGDDILTGGKDGAAGSHTLRGDGEEELDLVGGDEGGVGNDLVDEVLETKKSALDEVLGESVLLLLLGDGRNDAVHELALESEVEPLEVGVSSGDLDLALREVGELGVDDDGVLGVLVHEGTDGVGLLDGGGHGGGTVSGEGNVLLLRDGGGGEGIRSRSRSRGRSWEEDSCCR